MTDSKKKKAQYDMEYAKNKLKRIPLDVTKENYQKIKNASESVNESVNGFIKKAIDIRIDKINNDTTE